MEGAREGKCGKRRGQEGREEVLESGAKSCGGDKTNERDEHVKRG